jgi:hypothetical protein
VQAVDAVEDAAALAATGAPKPCAPASKPRWRESEGNEHLPELATIVAPDEEHSTRLSNDPELVEPIWRVPRDRWHLASRGHPCRIEHAPPAKVGEID